MVDRQQLYSFYALSHARRFIPDGSDLDLATAGALGVWDSRDERRALRTIAEVESEVRRLEGDPGADVAGMARNLEQAMEAVKQVRAMADQLREEDRETRAVLEASPDETTTAAARRVVAMVPDMGPSARDERERQAASDRLRRLILADGQTDTGGRWLYDAAADEIVRLRAEKARADIAAVGGLSAEEAEALRGAGWTEGPEMWRRPDGLGWRKDRADIIDVLRCIAAKIRAEKAPAVAHMSQPGKATGEESATAGPGSVAEEQGAAQEEPRCGRCHAPHRCKPARDSAPDAIPKPERVEVGQRWRSPAGLVLRVVAVDEDGDVYLSGDGVRYGGVKATEMLESDAWNFLGSAPEPQGPDGGTEKGDEAERDTSAAAADASEPTARDAVVGMLLRHGWPNIANPLSDGGIDEACAVRRIRAGVASLISPKDKDRACVAALEALDRGELRVGPGYVSWNLLRTAMRRALGAGESESAELAAERVKRERDEARGVAESATYMIAEANRDRDLARAERDALREQLSALGYGVVREGQPGTETVFDASRKTRCTFPRGADAREVLATVAELLGFKPRDAEEARQLSELRRDHHADRSDEPAGRTDRWKERHDRLGAELDRTDLTPFHRGYVNGIRDAYTVAESEMQQRDQQTQGVEAPDREALGRAVHEAWCEGWGASEFRPNARTWEECSDEDHRVDMLIGERLFAMGARHGRAEVTALARRWRDRAAAIAAAAPDLIALGKAEGLSEAAEDLDAARTGPTGCTSGHASQEHAPHPPDGGQPVDSAAPHGGSLLGTLWRLRGAPTQGAYEVVEHAIGRVRIVAQYGDAAAAMHENELRSLWEQVDRPALTPPAERYAAPGQDGGDVPAVGARQGDVKVYVRPDGWFGLAPSGRATPPVASAAPAVPESHAGGAGASPWRGIEHEVAPCRYVDGFRAEALGNDGAEYSASFYGHAAEERAREYAAMMSAPAGVPCVPVLAVGQDRAADNGVWCSAHGGRMAEPALSVTPAELAAMWRDKANESIRKRPRSEFALGERAAYQRAALDLCCAAGIQVDADLMRRFEEAALPRPGDTPAPVDRMTIGPHTIPGVPCASCGKATSTGRCFVCTVAGRGGIRTVKVNASGAREALGPIPSAISIVNGAVEEAPEPSDPRGFCPRHGAPDPYDQCTRCVSAQFPREFEQRAENAPAKPASVLPRQRWRCVGVDGDLEVWEATAAGDVALYPVRSGGRIRARSVDMLGLREWTFVSGPRE